MAQLLNGNIDGAKAAIQKGARLTPLPHSHLPLCQSLETLHGANAEPLWRLALAAGATPQTTQCLDYPSTRTGPILRAEAMAGHTPHVLHWVRMLIDNTWQGTRASGSSPAKWMIREGMPIETLLEDDVRPAFHTLSYNKSGAHRLIETLTACSTRVIPSTGSTVEGWGSRSLMAALLHARIDVPHLQMALDLGLDPFASKAWDDHLLMDVIYTRKGRAAPILSVLLPAMEKKDPERLRELLNGEYNNTGASLAHEAAKQFDVDTLRLLKERGLDFSRTDRFGNTFLHWTARRYGARSQLQLLPVIEWALEEGFDLGMENKKKETVFGIMTRVATPEALLAALASNIDLLDRPDKQGKTPRDYLLGRRDRDMVVPVIDKGQLEQSLPEAGVPEEAPKAPRRRL
jgi:hypothetical protein